MFTPVRTPSVYEDVVKQVERAISVGATFAAAIACRRSVTGH